MYITRFILCAKRKEELLRQRNNNNNDNNNVMHSEENKLRCIWEPDRKNKAQLRAATVALYPFCNRMQICIEGIRSGRCEAEVFYSDLGYSKGFRRTDNGGKNRLKMQMGLHIHTTLRCGDCVQY
jgi:hypothetical protein